MQKRNWTLNPGRLLAVLLIAIVAVGALAACGGAEPAAPAEEAPAAEGAAADSGEAMADDGVSSNQAPALQEMVRNGDLPPLAERLPVNPAVVVPVDGIGQYGGTWNTALVGGSDTAWLVRTVSYIHPMGWTPQWDGVVPNAVEDVIASDDASEYTFIFREGQKWSDGAPFTAHDLAFWWNDQILNPDLSPGGTPGWMRAGEADAIFEAVDDHTLKITFDAPNGLFLQNLATPSGSIFTRVPMHYCSQFHADHNTENLDALIAENNANDWVHLYQMKCSSVPGTPSDSRWFNGDLPTLMPWRVAVAYGEGSQMILERNPYYWKVDTEGNQLPYIDRVVYDILEDREVLLLKVLNGEIDMMSRHFNTNDNKAVIADNREAGEYEFFETRSIGNTTGFHFNLTHKDARMREIFNDKNFRIAMSHCLNRQEIIDVLYIGQGEPMQSAIPKDMAEFYDEEWYSLYTEFDQDLAHQYLADAGMTERDEDGYFLGPDGEPFSFVVQATEAFGFHDRAEMAVNQWQDCGVNAQLSIIDRTLLYQRKDANEHDVHVWGAGTGPQIFLDPRHFFPFSAESTFAQSWVTWRTNPSGAGAMTQPEEPPDIVKHQMDLYAQILSSGDQAVQNELMKEILAIAKDQFYVIGTSSSPPGYGIVKNNFHNVPTSMPGSWQYPTPAPTQPEQYWISGE